MTLKIPSWVPLSTFFGGAFTLLGDLFYYKINKETSFSLDKKAEEAILNQYIILSVGTGALLVSGLTTWIYCLKAFRETRIGDNNSTITDPEPQNIAAVDSPPNYEVSQKNIFAYLLSECKDKNQEDTIAYIVARTKMNEDSVSEYLNTNFKQENGEWIYEPSIREVSEADNASESSQSWDNASLTESNLLNQASNSASNDTLISVVISEADNAFERRQSWDNVSLTESNLANQASNSASNDTLISVVSSTTDRSNHIASLHPYLTL